MRVSVLEQDRDQPTQRKSVGEYDFPTMPAIGDRLLLPLNAEPGYLVTNVIERFFQLDGDAVTAMILVSTDPSS